MQSGRGARHRRFAAELAPDLGHPLPSVRESTVRSADPYPLATVGTQHISIRFLLRCSNGRRGKGIDVEIRFEFPVDHGKHVAELSRHPPGSS